MLQYSGSKPAKDRSLSTTLELAVPCNFYSNSLNLKCYKKVHNSVIIGQDDLQLYLA